MWLGVNLVWAMTYGQIALDTLKNWSSWFRRRVLFLFLFLQQESVFVHGKRRTTSYVGGPLAGIIVLHHALHNGVKTFHCQVWIRHLAWWISTKWTAGLVGGNRAGGRPGRLGEGASPPSFPIRPTSNNFLQSCAAILPALPAFSLAPDTPFRDGDASLARTTLAPRYASGSLPARNPRSLPRRTAAFCQGVLSATWPGSSNCGRKLTPRDRFWRCVLKKMKNERKVF